jgi:hypothetical protein
VREELERVLGTPEDPRVRCPAVVVPDLDPIEPKHVRRWLDDHLGVTREKEQDEIIRGLFGERDHCSYEDIEEDLEALVKEKNDAFVAAMGAMR